jgi:PAS domain S-box-containing protein/diguanylate cyclase (GGDEF)-like protein
MSGKQQPVDAWRMLIEALPDGAALADARQPDMPAIYVNPALERMSGYTAGELIGRNLRMLQVESSGQAGVRRLRDAIEAGVETRAFVQNQRKNGDSFWVEIHLVPIRDGQGQVTHWASLHREAEARGSADERGTGRFQAMAPSLLQRQDPLTGFRNSEAFEELLAHQLAVARREAVGLTVFLVGVDDLDRYSGAFDRSASDALLKRVSRVLGTCFRRASDVLARHDDNCFAVLATSMTGAQMKAHANSVCARVADLRVHHPRSRYRRYVTLSIGATGGTPSAGMDAGALLASAREALAEAQAEGDMAIVRELGQAD